MRPAKFGFRLEHLLHAALAIHGDSSPLRSRWKTLAERPSPNARARIGRWASIACLSSWAVVAVAYAVRYCSRALRIGDDDCRSLLDLPWLSMPVKMERDKARLRVAQRSPARGTGRQRSRIRQPLHPARGQLTRHPPRGRPSRASCFPGQRSCAAVTIRRRIAGSERSLSSSGCAKSNMS